MLINKLQEKRDDKKIKRMLKRYISEDSLSHKGISDTAVHIKYLLIGFLNPEKTESTKIEEVLSTLICNNFKVNIFGNIITGTKNDTLKTEISIPDLKILIYELDTEFITYKACDCPFFSVKSGLPEDFLMSLVELEYGKTQLVTL